MSLFTARIWEAVFAGSQDLVSTVLVLAALPGRQLAPDSARTGAPADTSLRWYGARNISHAPIKKRQHRRTPYFPQIICTFEQPGGMIG